jgi:cellulose biosynthesis protein BcsQ
MLRTITLCSGKGGVGKTLLSTSLARIIQREANCNVLLVDLDLSVSGLTLLAYHNKIELNQVPLSLIEYLSVDPDQENALLAALQKGLAINGEGDGEGQGTQVPSLYRRLENVYILPASTESERPDWTQISRLELDTAVEKLARLQRFVDETLDIDFLIFDTQAGLGSLSLAAATLSDMNLVVLEEDDISWRTSLQMFIEITELNKRLQHRSRSYFLANKVNAGLMDMASKLRAFAFLPPIPFDSWMQRLVSNATAAVLEKEFENSDFFRHLHTRVWQEIAQTFGLAQATKNSALSSWWRPQRDKARFAERPAGTNSVAPTPAQKPGEQGRKAS